MVFPDWLRYEMRERWERLREKFAALRNWVNRQNPKIILGVTGGCVFLLLVTVIGLLLSGGVPKAEEYDKTWFYDVNTGELFAAKKDSVPPIEAPSGPLANGQPAGVKAHVLHYVGEPNEEAYFIGFLETTDPNAAEEGSASASEGLSAFKRWGRGKLIRRVEDERWVRGDSREARIILNEAFRPNENGERPSYFRPR